LTQTTPPLCLSVIATVRNERETIAAFVESLLQQSHKPDEIIIVDGASTDGTREILDDYAIRHGIRVISQPCNIAQGRNLGIAAAQGSHIAVTDAGCRVDRDWLQEMLNCFLDNPDVEVAAGNFVFETHTPFEEAVVKATFQPDRGQTDQARFYPSSRSVAFTKAAWERAGGYPEWLYAAEDTLYNIRLRQIGCGFVFCRRAIVRWRPRETWGALARQRYNYSRGNARVGIGTAGYLKNLRIHGLVLAFLLLIPVHGVFLAGAIAVFALHVRRHLWPQAAISSPSWGMRLRVLAMMEFVRVVNLYAFLRGRWDRWSDPDYIARQVRYMGVSTVDELDTPV
jgi:glycosyltransferase involved in cell wall biosynthesis